MNTRTVKPTLLYVSNNFYAYGGGNCVMAWSLQALREDWDITLFCSIAPDFEAINRHFGTDIKRSDFSLKRLPLPLSHINRLDPDPFSVQRLCWLMRFSQSISSSYDAAMTCDDEFDFGRPGISYTHFPHMQRHMKVFQSVENLSGKQRFLKMLTGKLRPWLFISRIRLSRIKQNLMVTNSNWTADLLRDVYGVEPEVVYPPVVWDGSPVQWDSRRQIFVCLGRLSPTKRLLEIIDIIEKVRARGYEVELEIIGDEDAVAGEAYIQEIRDRIAETGEWVRLHQSVTRRELEHRVSSCRFGIHGMLEEHFGIAPAELVRAGCVVFVPNSGGQVEIVGDNPELRYDSDEAAVEQICQVLDDPSLQTRLRDSLAKQSELFTEKHFMNNIKKVVADFAGKNPAETSNPL